MDSVSIRYIVHDVDEAIRFYEEHLGFEVTMHPAPGFAALRRGGLRLLLNAPGAGGAGRAGGDEGGPGSGQAGPSSGPRPGGWNRFQVVVDDLEERVTRLIEAGVGIRGDVVHGKGGDQALAEDPSGNVVELFQPRD